MTSGASNDDAAVGWPFPAAVDISAPSWQSELTQQGQVPLIRPRVAIGNDATCEIVLHESGVAQRHAAITWAGDGYQIEDLGSINGTWVAGERIFEPTPLVPGTSIRIGGATLLFTSPLGEQATAAPSASPTPVAAPVAPSASPAQPLATVPVRTRTPRTSTPRTPTPRTSTPRTSTPPPAPSVQPSSQPQPVEAPRPAAQPAYLPPTPPPAVQPPPAVRAQAAVPGPPPPVSTPQQLVQLPASPHGFIPPAPIPPPESVAAPGQRFDFNTWLMEQQPRFYWKFFLIGLVVLILTEYIASSSQNAIVVPDIILIFSGLVPATFVIFLWEQGAEAAQISPILIVAAFGCGATVGLFLGSALDGILQANNNTLFYSLLIGVAEETGKVAALIYFMRDSRLRKEIHGLLLGAASGMGFAALETSGYGFVAFIQGLQQGGTFGTALAAANQQLLSRMLLAIFGHGVWTAIVCSAIWRERGNETFALTRGVVIAFLIAIGLHGLWDFSIGQNWLPITIGGVAYPGFDILIVGPLGLLILGFFLREAIEQARLGPAAPPPPPLDDALKAYFNAIFSRLSGGRPTMAPAQPYGTPVAPYPPTGPQAGIYPPQAPGQHSGLNAAPPYPQQPPQQPAAYPPRVVRQGQARPPAPVAAPHWPLPSQEQPSQQPPIWPLPPAQQPQPPSARSGDPHPLAHVPYCARCAITYPPGATICPNCGSPLTEAIGGR